MATHRFVDGQTLENIRLHYALTLEHWLRRFEAERDRVRAVAESADGGATWGPNRRAQTKRSLAQPITRAAGMKPRR